MLDPSVIAQRMFLDQYLPMLSEEQAWDSMTDRICRRGFTKYKLDDGSGRYVYYSPRIDLPDGEIIMISLVDEYTCWSAEGVFWGDADFRWKETGGTPEEAVGKCLAKMLEVQTATRK